MHDCRAKQFCYLCAVQFTESCDCRRPVVSWSYSHDTTLKSIAQPGEPTFGHTTTLQEISAVGRTQVHGIPSTGKLQVASTCQAIVGGLLRNDLPGSMSPGPGGGSHDATTDFFGRSSGRGHRGDSEVGRCAAFAAR